MPDNPTHDDSYARESFTFRRMKTWQIWTLSAIVAVLVVVAIASYSM